MYKNYCEKSAYNFEYILAGASLDLCVCVCVLVCTEIIIQ